MRATLTRPPILADEHGANVGLPANLKRQEVGAV
jgi:hypothetical protein